MIKGGYILHARKIKDSLVSKMAPCTREVWLHILREAFFTDTNNLKRGQLLTKIDIIREDLNWYVGYRKNMYSRRQVEGAFESLRKVGMIVTVKVTHGIIITVCKYDYYQNSKNYEWGNEGDSEDSANVQRKAYEGHNNNKEGKERKNTNSFSPPGGAFLGLYEKMMIVFKKHYPTYYKEDKRDYPACNIIADKIEKLKGWEHGSCMNGGMDAFLEYWDLMAAKASKHKWLGDKPLSKLSDDLWQTWCTHMSNQEKGISSKDPKPKVEKKEHSLVSAKSIASQYDR